MPFGSPLPILVSQVFSFALQTGTRGTQLCLVRRHHGGSCLGGIVREQHEIDVARRDLSLTEHTRLQPAYESGPVVPTEQDDRELINLSRLNERQCLEQLIERAE